MAPRRSELQRSGDYSGPSAVSGASRRAAPPTSTAGSPLSVVPRRYRAPGGRDLLRGLDATQRDAVTSRAAPLAILAGAGSGKTRVLTRRIAWQAREGNVDPRHVLAVTFTRKAAGELRTRLGRLGVRRCGHRRHVPRHRARAAAPPRRRRSGRTMPTLLERKVRLLVPLVDVRGSRSRAARRRARLRDRVGEGAARAARRLREGGRARRRALPRARPPRSPTSTASTSARSGERGLVDFDDLISGCADALERDADFAAAQRWRFRHLFVDEFQDASPAQFRLLRAWLGDRSDLCVVGDGDQAIYGFAGADPTFLVRFTAQFPPERFPDVGVVRLGSNYRSHPAGRGGRRRGARAPAPPRRGARGAARRPRCPSSPPTTPTTTKRAASRAALRAAHASDAALVAHRRALPGQRAVGAVRRGVRRAGVPFRVRGGGRFLDRPEVQGGARRPAGVGARRRRAARSPSTSPISVADRRRAVARSGASTSTRSCASAASTSTPRRSGARRGRRVGRRLPRVPPDRAARRRRQPRAATTRRAAHVPPGEGPRVRHRVRHRARARPGADLPRQDVRGARRGAAPPLCRAEPRRARAPR